MEYIHSMTFWGIKDFNFSLHANLWKTTWFGTLAPVYNRYSFHLYEYLKQLKDNFSPFDVYVCVSSTMQIKWICPTALTHPVVLLGGFTCTAWFDVGELLEEGPDDWEGLDVSVAHIVNLLSIEPADVKVGIGGFSMGAAIALYFATCYAMGGYGNGNPYPVNLRAVIGLSGWLPGSRNESLYRFLFFVSNAQVNIIFAELPLFIKLQNTMRSYDPKLYDNNIIALGSYLGSSLWPLNYLVKDLSRSPNWFRAREL
ncbi:hypothetical protein UlMin_015170 [Ulmus minor]